MEDLKSVYAPLIFSGQRSEVPAGDLISQKPSDSLGAPHRRRKLGRLDVYS